MPRRRFDPVRGATARTVLALGATVFAAAGCTGRPLAGAALRSLPTTYVETWAPVASAPTARTPDEIERLVALSVECACVRARTFRFAAGLEGGMSIPGRQDLKFIRHDSTGTPSDFDFSADIDATREAFESLYVSATVEEGPLRDYGLRLEAAHWKTYAQTDDFVDRIHGPVPSALPPFNSVREDRYAFFATLFREFPLPGESPLPDCASGFVGLGAGPVYTQVTHGHADWALGAQAVAGLSLPLADRVNLRLEGRYVLAHDQDCHNHSLDWCVDTSGTPTTPRWAHFDTRFFVLLVGVEFEF